MVLPPGFLEELRSRVSLAQVVGRKVVWDPRKTNAARGDYWAPCPFHAEKTASFHVDDAKGFYYCFGCNAKGDALGFLRETEALGFLEAVELLAREAGLTMPARDPAAAARAQAALGLVEAMEAAVQFYRLQLSTARAAAARAYLDRRGLSAETRAAFEIGFAPDGRTALLEHLTSRGFTASRLAEAGLVGLPETGSPYDRFRGRIMFPIRDARGRPVAFGARALSEGQEPKYLNSPETPLFDKSQTLYNAGPARASAAKAGTVLVVEGYMDVIALAQAGLGHAVAPLGTAITEAQLGRIWRLSPEPVVALDGDRAGRAAAQRLIDLALPLLAPQRSLRFVLLPPGQDPDDMVRTGGARAMQALIAASRPMIDLVWTRETEGAVLDSPERRAALEARLRSHVGRITEAGIRTHWQAEIRKRCATLFGSQGPRPNQRRRARGSIGRPFGVQLFAQAPAPALATTRASLLACAAPDPASEARVRESAILAGCLHHAEVARSFEDRLERMVFLCPDLDEIRRALLFALAAPLDCTHHGADTREGDTHASSGPRSSLAHGVAARLGRDPLPALTSVGQVRANPHLGPGADPAQAAQAVLEELNRHEAATGIADELREAEQEVASAVDEGLTWRLKQAVEAGHRASAGPFAAGAGPETAEAAAALSSELQALIDSEIWRKPRKR